MLRGGTFAHTDHHRAVADDENVPALDGGRCVPHRIVAVVEHELLRGEHRMEVVDQPGVDGLALPCRFGHRVEVDPGVDPRRIVALEQMIGQRREEEVVVVEAVEQQARHATEMRRRLSFEHAADQQLGQLVGCALVEQLLQGSVEFGPELGFGDQLGRQLVARTVLGECLGEQVLIEVDRHPEVAQYLLELLVLLLRLLGPHHVVEQQSLDVVGCETQQLDPRLVQDDLGQRTHFGVDVESHTRTLIAHTGRRGTMTTRRHRLHPPKTDGPSEITPDGPQSAGEPPVRIELTTARLQGECSTTELRRHACASISAAPPAASSAPARPRSTPSNPAASWWRPGVRSIGSTSGPSPRCSTGD